MDKKYRVGIVGFGAIGKVHAYAYATLPFHTVECPLEARITHVVTGREETALAAQKLVNADVASTDHRTVTENPDIDIVHICTPNHLHLEPLLTAMAAGKHIYCEKPLVNTWDEAVQVREALKTYDATAQMVFHYRFFPAVMRAKQLIDAGAIGEVLEFRTCYFQASQADADLPMRWKSSVAQGGGVIADIASHALELTEYMAGPFARIMAATQIAYPERRNPSDPSKMETVDAEDSVAMMVRLPNGALGTIQATKLATGTENEMTLEIFGTKGAIRFMGMDPHHLLFHDATQPEKPCGGDRGWLQIAAGHRYEPPHSTFPATKSNIGWQRAHGACLAEFLTAVSEGRKSSPDLERGIEVQHLIECVRRSAKSEQWVEV